MALLGDLAALAVTFALTGWLLSLVVLPEPVGAARRAGLALSTAVPAALLAALPGLVLDRLGTTAFLLGVAGLTLLATFRTGTLAALRRSPRQVLGRLRAAPRRAAGRRGVPPAGSAAAPSCRPSWPWRPRRWRGWPCWPPSSRWHARAACRAT